MVLTPAENEIFPNGDVTSFAFNEANPVPVGPAAPFHTGNSSPVPATPVHTGTEVKQADSIVTTTFPAGDIPPLQDFIY